MHIKSADSNLAKEFATHPIRKRTVKTQAGESFVAKHVSVVNDTMTPTRKRKVDFASTSTSTSTSTSNERNSILANIKLVLPGKKSQVQKKTTTTPPCKNKCEICKVIYASKHDKELGKQFRGRKNQWIGCDVNDCDYWVHSRCVGIKITGKTENFPFLCPKHKS